jgi:hypothetical protein
LPKWAADIMTTAERQSLRGHIQRQIDTARADERRKALEEAIAAVLDNEDQSMASHTANCHSAARIRTLIDRKEPTT